MKRDWCRIHGKPEHMQRVVCATCGRLKDGFGKLTCQATCAGEGLKRWLKDGEDQRTWRCVEA